jgi:hypothetical protein
MSVGSNSLFVFAKMRAQSSATLLLFSSSSSSSSSFGEPFEQQGAYPSKVNVPLYHVWQSLEHSTSIPSKAFILCWLLLEWYGIDPMGFTTIGQSRMTTS